MFEKEIEPFILIPSMICYVSTFMFLLIQTLNLENAFNYCYIFSCPRQEAWNVGYLLIYNLRLYHYIQINCSTLTVSDCLHHPNGLLHVLVNQRFTFGTGASRKRAFAFTEVVRPLVMTHATIVAWVALAGWW